MAIRTFDELLGDHAGRIARLERRLSKGGFGSAGSTSVQTVPMVSGTVTAAQNTAATARISFPPGYFAAPPVVTVSLNEYKANADVIATNITKDYFEYITYNTTSGGNLTGVALSWRATPAGSGGSANVQAPALPDPVTIIGPQTTSVSQAAATWADFSPVVAVTYTLDNPMWVAVDGSGQLSGAASTYAMIGVAASGALTLGGEVDQASGRTDAFGHTAYSEVSANGGKTLTFHKTLLLPKGTTTLRMQHRRNVTSGVPGVSYATMTVTPLSWAGSPGPSKSLGGLIGIAPASVAVTNGTFIVTGNKVSFTGCGSISLNGIFDPSIADEYQIEVKITTGPAAGGWVRMRKAGVDTTGNVYGNQQTYNNAASTLVTAYAATSGWVFAPSVGIQEKFTLKLSAPHTPGPEYVFAAIDAAVQTSSALTNGTNKGTTAGQSYDGCTIQSASGVISGWLRVYALT